jgi:hypothetical protein
MLPATHKVVATVSTFINGQFLKTGVAQAPPVHTPPLETQYRNVEAPAISNPFACATTENTITNIKASITKARNTDASLLFSIIEVMETSSP